jgi:hypothetical protein
MFPPSKSNRTTRVDTDDDVILPSCLQTLQITLDMLVATDAMGLDGQVTKVGGTWCG